jgi:acetyl-CoA acetyltransferase
VIVMLQLESLGLCKRGEAAAFLRGKDLGSRGDFPLNTSGGMLSLGQAGAAGGFLGITEAVRQVTGTAGPTAVPGARVGLVSCYGTVNYDRGLCASAAIIETGKSAATETYP